MRFRTCTEQG